MHRDATWIPKEMHSKPRDALQESSDSSALVRWLSGPSAYGDEEAEVELRETHISWVFLTTTHAYKLKKPVRFGFVDFSTVELRRAACEAEVRLNRRLTDGIYLDLLPVTRDRQGVFRLGGEGTPIDWIVHMRRLPAERMLDQLIAEQQVVPHEVDRLAERLAKFYQQAPPLKITAADYRAAIEAHVRGNLEELSAAVHELPAALIRRIHGNQLRWLALDGAREIDNRVSSGRIIDGHGDLRPEHVCLTEPIQIFDCIEFSDDLRRIDIADELAFLAVECERLGAEWIGRKVLHEYQRTNGDDPAEQLISFYKSYRAAVRAKVAVLRSEQLSGPEREAEHRELFEYLALAERHAANLAPPVLLVVRGLMGTGKTTLANALAKCLGAEILATDAIRRELFGASDQPAAYGGGNYGRPQRQQVYTELFGRAAESLQSGLAVILDATFLAAKNRTEACELARRHGAIPLVVVCHCPEETARERIENRRAEGGSLSEARAELFSRQRADEEPDIEETPLVRVDTTQPIGQQVETVLDELRRRVTK